MKKLLAFTLAETLIVMGIIGVVAALTLPNLNSSTGDREKVAKVKKIYQNLNDAFGRAEAVYGPFEEWFVNDSDIKQKTKRFAERMTEFMKISKNCEFDGAGCFTTGKYYMLNGQQIGQDFAGDKNCYKVVTADGTSMAFYNRQITIDIDGSNKGSYTSGKDLFRFGVSDSNGLSDGELSIYSPSMYRKNDGIIMMELCNYGSGGERWILEFGNMDYLKADSNCKCKNSSIILDRVNNTTCK